MTVLNTADPVYRLLEARRINYFAVIDDAFGPPVRKDFPSAILDSFWADIEEDAEAVAELNAIAGIEITGPPDFTDQVLGRIVSQKDKLRKLQPYYTKHLDATVASKFAPLKALVENLELDLNRKVTCHTSMATFDNTRAQVIFVDYFMGPAGEAASVRIAKDIVSAIIAKYTGVPLLPLLVLMSASEVNTEMVADFQASTGWLGGMFHFVRKQAFLTKDLLALKLAKLVHCLPAGQAIQGFVDGLRKSIHDVAEKFIKDVSTLGVEDYAYIQFLSLQEDGHPLGDYMLWLYSSYFGRLLFGSEEIRNLQKSIDQITFEDLPPAQTKPSSLLGEIYKSSLFDVSESNLTHPRAPEGERTANPDQLHLHLGDLFLKDANSDLLMVLNAQCDLAFTPDSHHRPFRPEKTVLLIPGRLHEFASPISDFDANKPRTELFEHEEHLYRIIWDTKRVLSQRIGELGQWLRSAGYQPAGFRLRLPFALQLQQLFASDLTRVGMPVAPPLSRPVSVQLWAMSGNGKAELLVESPDSAFVFLTRRGEQCVLKEELAHDMKLACAKAVELLVARVTFLEEKKASAETIEKFKVWHADVLAYGGRIETLFELRGPFLVPPGKDPVKLEDRPVLVARGAAPGGTFRYDQPLLINIVPQ